MNALPSDITVGKCLQDGLKGGGGCEQVNSSADGTCSFSYLFLADGVGEGSDDGVWGREGVLKKKEVHVCKLIYIRFVFSHFLSDDDGGDDDDDNNKKRMDESCFSIAKFSQFV